MRWYVARDGKTEGPFQDAEMVDLIRSGSVAKEEQIRDEGGTEWLSIEKHPTMAAHLPNKRATARPARRGVPWLTIAALAGVLSMAAMCALIFLELRTHDAMIARIDNVTKHVDGVLTEIREANEPAPWVPEAQVHNNCLTDRTTVTCTFTNLTEKPVSTCTRGRITQKGAPGVKLESLIMCTGKLLPAESRVVSGPWVGGFADDICYKQNEFGKSLDWGKCEFTSEAVDLPTMRKMSAVASAK